MYLLCFVLFGPFIERDAKDGGFLGVQETTDRSPLLAPLLTPPRPPAGPDDRALALLQVLTLLRNEDLRKDPGAKKDAAPGARRPDDSPGVKKERDPKDYRPPRDIATDRINASARSRPIFVTKNQDAVARQAAELGKPVLWWSFWPDTYDTTSSYFNELSEAQHILMTGDQISRNKVDGQEWVVYQHRDGEPRWIKAADICGAECAVPLRKAWFEPKVQSGLTADDKEAVLDVTVRIVVRDGEQPRQLSLREILGAGYQFSYADYKALERKGLSELEVAYVASLSGRLAGGSTVPSIGTTYTPRGSAPQYGTATARYTQPPAAVYQPRPSSTPAASPAFRVGGAPAGAPLRGG